MTVTVDERGRILIPKELREAHGLSPGSAVVISETNGGIEIRRALSRQDALKRLEGAIPKDARGPRLDPLKLKKIWEPRL